MNKELAVIGKNETAVAAAAENARAMVESSYTIAIKYPRDEDAARQNILASCKRRVFAESGLYKKPVGSEKMGGKWEKKYAIGLSIRAAEEAMRLWGNMRATTLSVYEDESKRIINTTVIDLQTNATHSQDTTLMKHIEKKFPKDGMVPVSERVNSNGDITYIVNATAEELDKKQGAAVSKMIRNHVLRLLPAELKEEMTQTIEATKLGHIEENPADARKKLIDAFHTIGISVDKVRKLADEDDLDALSASQVSGLRDIYTTIKSGNAKYSDYVGDPKEEKPDAKLKKAKQQPKKGTLKAGGETLSNAGQADINVDDIRPD